MISLEQFKKICKDHRIVCFGRSEGFLAFSRMMNSFGADGQIDFVVDNDDSLWSTRVPGYGISWSVYSPESLKGIYHNYIIVVTVQSKEGFSCIQQQLKGLVDSDIPVIHFKEFYDEWIEKKKETLDLPSDFRLYDRIMIPKTIHYCWFGQGSMPDKYVEWMKSWEVFCPDYEIVRWDESNYDIDKNKYMRDAYSAGKWSFVSDYARLDIIYNYGGIYLDTDVELIKPLDVFLYEDGFAGYLPDERIATGLGFGARKGLPVIKELMKDYANREFVCANDRKEKISIQMCSEIQTEYLLRNDDWRYTNGIVDMDGLRVYPSPVFDGINADEETRDRLSYSIHHYAGSWLNEG